MVWRRTRSRISRRKTRRSSKSPSKCLSTFPQRPRAKPRADAGRTDVSTLHPLGSVQRRSLQPLFSWQAPSNVGMNSKTAVHICRTASYASVVTWRLLTFVINNFFSGPITTTKAMNTIRCPYCLENGAFKPMSSQGSGEWWVCQTCGHLSLPSKRFFECTWSKCIGASRGLRDRTLGQNVKIRLQLLYQGVRSLMQQWR